MNCSQDFNWTDNTILENSVVEDVERYYTPILIILGSIGNGLSVIVFFSTKLRKLSSSIYLAALAISDTGFLICLLASWLDLVDVRVFNRQGLCQLIIYTNSVFGFLSAWLVVAFTVERFVAVLYPLRRASMCTVTRAKIVLASLSILAFLAFLPLTRMVGMQQKRCNSTELVCELKPEWIDAAHLFNSIDMVTTFVLPFSVIATLNARIVLTVWKFAWIRRSMTLTVRGDVFNQQTTTKDSRRKGQSCLRSPSSQIKVTKMLLVVSTVFLVLNLPSYVTRVIGYVEKIAPGSFPIPEKDLISLQHVCNMLYNTNFGINFVLYCVSGQNFRRVLGSVCVPRLRRNDTTQATVVSEYIRSSGSIAHRKTVTVDGHQAPGSWKDAHELLPLTK